MARVRAGAFSRSSAMAMGPRSVSRVSFDSGGGSSESDGATVGGAGSASMPIAFSAFTAAPRTAATGDASSALLLADGDPAAAGEGVDAVLEPIDRFRSGAFEASEIAMHEVRKRRAGRLVEVGGGAGALEVRPG